MNNSRIDTAVTHCCGDGGQKTFTVHAEDIPAFLGPLMVSNFSVAFANLGMQPVQEDGDLEVELRYEQDNLSRDRKRDDFDEAIATGDSMRFFARIAIDVRDATTGNLVWSGQIQRLHTVGPGDYMHTGPASIAIFEAFTRVLQGYRE
ncbi:MAG: hypothetical protein WD601_01030 [Pseudohongiellaceae bacterium]